MMKQTEKKCRFKFSDVTTLAPNLKSIFKLQSALMPQSIMLK